jgi:hypothetical protein
MALERPPQRQLRAVYDSISHAIGRQGFRLIERSRGHVIIGRNDDVSSAHTYRIEVSMRVPHELFGTVICADLIVPWAKSADRDMHRVADRLNRTEAMAETLMVGIWHADSERGRLRYRILLPYIAYWMPVLELCLSSLVRRWMDVRAAEVGLGTDVELIDGWSAHFSSMRSGNVRVLKELWRPCAESLENYHRDLAARELIAAMLDMPVRSVNRYLPSLPKKPC